MAERAEIKKGKRGVIELKNKIQKNLSNFEQISA